MCNVHIPTRTGHYPAYVRIIGIYQVATDIHIYLAIYIEGSYYYTLCTLDYALLCSLDDLSGQML